MLNSHINQNREPKLETYPLSFRKTRTDTSSPSPKYLENLSLVRLFKLVEVPPPELKRRIAELAKAGCEANHTSSLSSEYLENVRLVILFKLVEVPLPELKRRIAELAKVGCEANELARRQKLVPILPVNAEPSSLPSAEGKIRTASFKRLVPYPIDRDTFTLFPPNKKASIEKPGERLPPSVNLPKKNSSGNPIIFSFTLSRQQPPTPYHSVTQLTRRSLTKD